MSFWTMPLPGLMRSAEYVPEFPAEFVSISYAGGTAAASVARPAGLIEDDFMLAFVSRASASGALPTPPAGWSKILDNGGFVPGVYAKIAGASEPTSYTFSASGLFTSVAIVAYRHISRVAAAGIVALTPTAPGITLPRFGSYVGLFTYFNAGNGSVPAGMTMRGAYDAFNPSVVVADVLNVPKGPTGDKTVTWPGSSNSRSVLVGID